MRTAAIAVLALSSAAWAADVRVPEDVASLKDALLTAQAGDRIIVTGGTWRNGRVYDTDVQLVGRAGATLTGLWEVTGTRVVVEGFRIRDGQVQVSGADVTLRRNRFEAARYAALVSGEGTSGLVFEDNRCRNAVVLLRNSQGTLARSNRFVGGELIVYGSGSTAEANVCSRGAQIGLHDGTGIAALGNRGGNLHVSGASVVQVRGNRSRGGSIGVLARSALVVDNELTRSTGFYVRGDSAIVQGNRATFRLHGMEVEGDSPDVRENVLTNARTKRGQGTGAVLLVLATGTTQVADNEVGHTATRGIEVRCDASEVARNTVRGRDALDALVVLGDQNSVHDNVVEQLAGRQGRGSGIVVQGDGNAVADNSVTGAGYDGVVVRGATNLVARARVTGSGRCGITVDEAALTTSLADCIVQDARWSSMFLLGEGTVVTGGSFLGGGRVDVLDLGDGTQYVEANYQTFSLDPALAPYR